jgi:hypothetical protein
MSNTKMEPIREESAGGIWLVSAPTMSEAAIFADLNLPVSQRIKSISPLGVGEFVVVSTERTSVAVAGRRADAG